MLYETPFAHSSHHGLRALEPRRPVWHRIVGLAGIPAALIGGFMSCLLAIGSLTSWRLALAAAGLGALGVVGAFAVSRFVWVDRSAWEGAVAIASGLVLALLTFFVAGFAVYVVVAANELCGTGAGGDVAVQAAGVAAYLAVGGWSFLRPGRLLFGWPLAVCVGLAAMVAVQALVPAGHGYCST